ncbi:hypothetical protein ZIOFF_074022 [Zingiber officinale]|uniref:Cupin type-1 domain-containing protein n=2 Tax=Zingiber officinale TaxID=94328 RepID=A0A8J5BZH4_ZINOF|nr:hypothetical protein ZIOFF_074022 [Zingiber officinale]
MATKFKGLLVFLAVVLFVSSSVALSFEDVLGDNPKGDPEQRLEQCRQQCQRQQHGQQQRMRCERSCDEKYQKERKQQQEREQQGEDRERDPAALRECRDDCRKQEYDRSQQQRCERWCEEQYREERGRHQGNPRRREGEREEEEEEQEEEEHNPYLFDRESFRWIEKTEHGDIRVLPNFLEKSKLLLGIANYRIMLTQLKPHGFALPKHLDADAIAYVAQGSGVITLICQDKRETYELQQGGIIKVPAGAIEYVANKDSREKLVLIELLIPVSTPGLFELFYGAGAQNFLRSFSDEILEAAFNTRRDRLQRLLGQQKKAGIVRASEEQIHGLSRRASEGRQWPFGESKGTFNLLRKRPSHSSKRGHMYQADGNDYQPLKQHDVQVSYANITQGSMIAPSFNSRAIKIVMIVEGEGYIETICPRSSNRRQSREREGQREEEGQGQWFKRVRSHVRPGSLVVIPPGQPSVTVASTGGRERGNFEAICFDICAEKNERNFLAGRNNVWNQMGRVAKELAFDMPEKEVDEVLQSQKEQIIVAGPEEREGGGHRRNLPVLEVAAAFM